MPKDSMAAESPMRVVLEGLGMLVVFGLAMAGALVPALPNAAQWTGDILPVWIWSGLAMLPLLSMHRLVDAWFSGHRIASVLLILTVCVAAVWMALGENLDARLGAIDDHEIVAELGPGHSHARWKDWPVKVAHSEATTFGSVGRYRPAFYAVRLAECCAWGKDATEWYVAHMILCLLMLALLWFIAQSWWGASLSFAFVFFVLGLPPVGDIYARLAASEAYAMPAFLLGLWAWGEAFKKRPCAWVWWWVGALGFGIAELCKENFVPLAGLAAMAGMGLLWQNRASRQAGAWAAAGFLALMTLAMTVIVVRMILATGKDYYGNEMNAGGILQGMSHGGGRLLLALCPFLGWGLLLSRHSKEGALKIAPERWRAAVVFLGFMAAAWLSQVAFYRNIDWPSGTRYDFPGLLIPYVVLISGGLALLGLIQNHEWRRVGQAGMVLLLLTSAGAGVVHNTVAQSKLNSLRTKRFSTWLTSVANLAKSAPDVPLILVPDNAAMHYEPVISVYRYLRYKKISNRVLYTTKFIDAEPNPSALERNTIQTMKDDLRTGNVPGLEKVDDLAWPANALFVPFGEREALQLNEGKFHTVNGFFDDTRR